MSLTDGYKKMSKSDPTKWSCLYFTDSADTITKKILKAKTDSIENVFFFKMTKKGEFESKQSRIDKFDEIVFIFE